MDADDEHHGTDEDGVTDARAHEPFALRRILDARWPLLAAAAVLGYAAAAGMIGGGFAVAGLALVAAAAAFGPRSRRSGRTARTRARTRAVWPDTGMKIAVDAFPLPCVIVDHKGIVRHGNQAARELIGPLPPGDPLAYRLRLPQVLATLEQVAAGGPAEAVEWRQKVPSERVMEARFSPIRLPNSQRRHPVRPDFIVIAFFDLTKLHQLDRMRADFVANASHELRTPLASLTGFIETLQGPARDDPAARENFLSIMLDQANRMGRLINDLLSLSRIEMKGHVRPDQQTELRAVIDHVVDSLAPLAKEVSVRVDVVREQDRIVVAGDHDELVQVFQNLVENALRYGASGERIEIADRLERDAATGAATCHVSVRDWGPGIAPEHLPRLTERFYRADIEKSRLSHGTGLGLAIVKHIVNRHGGRLLIKSEPGHGATFTVVLPLVMGPDIRGVNRQRSVANQ